MDILHFVYPFMGISCVCITMNIPAMSISCTYFWMSFCCLSFLDKYLGVELLDHMETLCLSFSKAAAVF